MRSPSERTIVFLIGAVQFINILDFMMVMPLGPDFSRALGVPTARLGLIGGSYTASAALAGLAGSFFLDRFDRRRALGVAMLGLVVGTASAALAHGLGGLMAARLLAGAFGGPATSLAFSIIADVVPPERRGKATGAVMAAFSVASVLGVPIGLRLAREGGWQAPFLAVAGLGLLVAGGAVVLLPPMRGHLSGQRNLLSLGALLGRKTVLLSYAMTAVVMMAGFSIIPNLSAFVQYNLGLPRGRLEGLYLIGGVASFITLQTFGRLVDRFGSFRVGALASVFLLVVLYLGFARPSLPVVVLFVSFMVCLGIRNVAYNTLTSKVPRPDERARFMSIQSAVQHFASAAGAFLSATLLVERPDHVLEGVGRIVALSMVLTAALPFLLRAVERRVTEKGG